MAFPDTGSLDTFAGADENPIAANWTSPVLGGNAAMQVVSGELAAVSAYGQAYWDAAQFGPHVETWAVLPTWTDACYTGCRLKGGGSSEDGYWAWFNPGGAGLVRIYRSFGNVWDALVETVHGMAAGDRVGIRAIRGTIEAWHKPAAGAWGLVNAAGDLTHPMPGYAGVMLAATGDRISEVGGGTLTPDFAVTPVFGQVAPSRGGAA